MDSVPVDGEWDAVGAGNSASSERPRAEDERGAAQVVSELRHPHLIVMRKGAAGFEPELAGGMSLAELCRAPNGWSPLPLRVSLRILLDALSGLAALHVATRAGNPLDFVHGEVCPGNIILGRDGLGRLIPLVRTHFVDRAPASSEATGYMAPERLLGDVFDQRADVFSAGVLLWEAVTGKPLFRNWPLDAIVTQLIGRKVPYPIPFGDALWGVPLADVAMRALAVDPEERWAHVGALGAQIETIVRGHLASTEEMAALLAGFTAGKGHASINDAPTMPPPPNGSSLTPLATSITAATAPSLSVEPPPVVETGQSGPLTWEGPSVSGPRKWPTDEGMADEQDAVSAAPELSESWNGLEPASERTGFRRYQTAAWAVLSATAAFAAVGAYKLVYRSESRTTATVLAAPSTATAGASTPAGEVSSPATVKGEPPAPPAPLRDRDTAVPARGTATAAPPPPAPAPAARNPPSPANLSATSAPGNRAAPKSAPRQAAPVPPAGTASSPRGAPPAAPPAPPAQKTKPKEDLFGI